MAEMVNVTNATMYATNNNCRESEIQMSLLRCSSNLASCYGLAVKEKANIWSKSYFGEGTTIPPEAQQHYDHHRFSPPLDAHVQVLGNYEVLTSATDLLDPLQMENPEVSKFLGVTQRTFFFVFLSLSWSPKNTNFVVSPR